MIAALLNNQQVALAGGGTGVFVALAPATLTLLPGDLTITLGTVSSTVITGGIEFVKSDGTRLIVFGTDGGCLYKLNTDGTTTLLLTGATADTKWYFAQYKDILLIGNRADAPRRYDGTTVAALGGTPPTAGGPVAVHGNRVFWLDGVNKSRLTWSALDNPEDYTTASNAGNVDVSTNDGSDLVNFVPSVNELVLLKGARPYRLQGTSPSTFTITNVVPTTGSVGAVSTQAALFALNDVWYLGTPGLTRLTAVQGFGDLRESFPSTPIQPYFEADSDSHHHIEPLQNLEDAVMAYDAQRNRIYVAADNNDDGKNDTILCYDGATKGWTVWDALQAASMWPVKNLVTGQSEIYAGGYDGHIRVLNRRTDETAFIAEATHLSALNAPGVEKSVRHLYLYLKEEGNQVLDVTVQFDFGVPQELPVSLLGSSHTLGVNWVLGVDQLGLRDQISKRIDIHGSGEFMALTLRNDTAGQTFTWYGFEALYRVKRTVRRGTGTAVPA